MNYFHHQDLCSVNVCFPLEITADCLFGEALIPLMPGPKRLNEANFFSKPLLPLHINVGQVLFLPFVLLLRAASHP